MRPDVFVMLCSITLGAFGQLLLKVAVDRMGGVDLSLQHLLTTVGKLVTNGWLITGVMMFVISMLLWLKVISSSELSRAYPSVSLSYLIVFLFSIILFKESITVNKVVGIFSILFGVFMMHR